MTLSEFINGNKTSLVTEAIRIRELEQALKNIKDMFHKHNIYTIQLPTQLTKDGKATFGILSWNEKNQAVMLCWKREDTAHLDSILFSNDFDAAWNNLMYSKPAPFKWDVGVECKGASLVKCIQLAINVMSGKTAMSVAAINNELKDYMLWEAESEELGLKQTLLLEASDDPEIAKMEKEKSRLYQRIRDHKKKGEDVSDMESEYNGLTSRLKEAKLKVKKNVVTISAPEPEIQQFEDQFEEEERATPEERFEDMESYIINVLVGIRPLAVICGAPGVGKTFRIMQAVKKEGKVMGEDYGLIKGKCTPANFYMMLHDYKNEGQLLILDDADEIVKDDVAINLIKAACDSSDERWVSYGTSNPPIMPEERAMMCDDAIPDPKNPNIFRYPKEFLFEGGMIIITNMRAGQLDTAIKNRALLCDLNFTTDEILDLVRSIAPKIKPGILPDEAKEKALGYLQELADKKTPMEISIRSFTLVAGLFTSDAPEKAIQRRIREQMKLQFMRGGKKY